MIMSVLLDLMIDGSYPFFGVFHGHSPHGFLLFEIFPHWGWALPALPAVILVWYRPCDLLYLVYYVQLQLVFPVRYHFFAKLFVFESFRSRSCYSRFALICFHSLRDFLFAGLSPVFLLSSYPETLRTSLCHRAFPAWGVSHMRSPSILSSSRKWVGHLSKDKKTTYPRWVLRGLNGMNEKGIDLRFRLVRGKIKTLPYPWPKSPNDLVQEASLNFNQGFDR